MSYIRDVSTADSKITPYNAFTLSKKRKSGDRQRIRFRTSFTNVVLDALRGRGWKETQPTSDDASRDSDWDIVWIDKEWMREVFDTVHLRSHQRVNHFRNHFELTRKDHLAKNIKRTARNLARLGRATEAAEYDFIPKTYNLPQEYSIFVEEFKKYPQQSTQWIMKPVGRCQGRGIFLFTKLNEISEWKAQFRPMMASAADQQNSVESYVVQRYIHNPLLIGGKKFDLRLFVLVTSFSPLVVWIYRSGFARFTSSRYTLHSSQLGNSYIHLTNVAVQKKNDNYNSSVDLKWDLGALKLYLINKFGDERVNALFHEIQNVVIKSLLGVQRVIIQDKHCFELYGYDILIDRNLKVWLLEVNSSPSFTASSDDDYLLKHTLVNDTLDLIDVSKKLIIDNELQIGGYDLIYKNGNVEYHNRCVFTSYLGCMNPSIAKNRKMVAKNEKYIRLRAKRGLKDDNDSDSDNFV